LGTVTIVNDFINTIGASQYFQINAGYPDSTGQAPSNVIYGGATGDQYSRGTVLTEVDLDNIVADQIASGEFPEDEQGIFVVLTSSDVTVEGAYDHFCITCCTLHRYFQVNGKRFKSILSAIPGAARCSVQPIPERADAERQSRCRRDRIMAGLFTECHSDQSVRRRVVRQERAGKFGKVRGRLRRGIPCNEP
jgi:hypothetical protein